MINQQEWQEMSPYGQYEEVEVTFPSTAHTDVEVPHSLAGYTPEHIDYQIIRQNQPAIVYHDGSADRRPWQKGYIIVRCNIPNAVVTLRLSVRHKQAALSLLPVEIPTAEIQTSNLLQADVHLDTETVSPARGDLIVRDNAGKWTRKAIGASGTFLQSDGSDPIFSTVGTTLTALNASNISSGTLADGRLSSNVPLKDTAATLSGIYTFSANPVFNANAIPETAIADGSLLARLAANETVAGTWDFTPGLKERGRSVALGAWTQVAYNSGNFTASGAMTWTVDSGDQGIYDYTLIGKTMIVVFTISNTDVGGTAGISLQLAVPGGFTAARQAVNPIHITDAGTLSIGYAVVATGGTVILLRKANNANWTLTTGDNTSVTGTIIFEVQ